MDQFERVFEQIKVRGEDLAKRVAELIREGNVRRIIVRDESGHTFMEIPLTVAAIGVIAAPVLAAVGAIATLVSKFEVVIERAAPAAAANTENTGSSEALKLFNLDTEDWEPIDPAVLGRRPLGALAYESLKGPRGPRWIVDAQDLVERRLQGASLRYTEAGLEILREGGLEM